MDAVPLKVLLVHRGEPFPFPVMGASSLAPPFIYVQTAVQSFDTLERPLLPLGYDAYVLPARFFLDLPMISRPPICLAYGPPEDMFSCFEAGAADYLRDGWNLMETASRLYRLWRPAFLLGSDRLSLSGSGLHLLSASESGERSLELTPWEAGFLRSLFAHPERLVPAQALGTSESGREAKKKDGALSMRVSRLRSKLDSFDSRISPRIAAGGKGSYAWRMEGSGGDS